MLPEVDTAREYWTPSVEQAIQLAAIEDQEIRNSNAMFLEWRQANQAENARGKHTYGGFNKWITLFEDQQITTCETVGVVL